MRLKGLSLIECLLAVSILGVLAAAGGQLQNRSWQLSQRAMARSALAQASWWLEHEATQTGTYPGVLPSSAWWSEGLSYNLTLTTSSAGYVLRAIPQGRQNPDACGTLWLNQLGQRGADGGYAGCW